MKERMLLRNISGVLVGSCVDYARSKAVRCRILLCGRVRIGGEIHVLESAWMNFSRPRLQ